MAYIGKPLDYGTISKQVLTANGSTTVFTLDQVVRTAKELIVSVGGVVQEPDVVYSASGTTLTFTTAPINGHRVWVIFLGRELSDGTYQDNVMTTAKFQNNAVTDAKIATMSASKLTGALPAIDGSALTGIVADFSVQFDNIALLGFKLAAQENLAKYDLVDQMVDEYYDTTGIDAGASTNASAGGSNPSKYYSSTNVNTSPSVDSYTKLLLHFDTSGLVSNAGNSVAAITKGSGLTQDTTNKVYGASSAANNGSSSGIHVAYNADWGAWGTQDLTVDFRFRLNNLNDNQALISGETDNQYFAMRYKSGYLNLNSNNAGWYDHAGTKTNYTIGQWYHVAIVQHGTSLKVYVDGVLDNSRTTSGAFTTGSRLSIFGDWGDPGNTWYPNGNMDEFRLSLGIARWTANFTPPTMAHPTTVTTYNAAMSLVSTTTTALAAPTTSSLVTLIENSIGTATLNTDIKGYVSRNGGTGWDQVTLVDEGTWGTNKKILAANDKTFSNSASGTAMKYKIETANQSYTAATTAAYETGNRSSTITVTKNGITTNEGNIVQVVDGLNADNYQAGSRFVFDVQTPSAGSYLRFTHSTARKFNEVKWYGCSSANGTWKWQGSNDGSSFTDLGGSFTLGGVGWQGSVATTIQTQTSLSANTTAYTIYQLTWVSGALNGNDYQAEVEFKTVATAATGKQTRVHAVSMGWE